jgi:hypothetical protein
MRKYMASLAVLTFLLFALGAMAQTSGSYGQSNPPSASSSSTEGQNSSTTTSTTTSQTTTSPQQASANFDGCVVKEQADYFLVPRSGSPIKLQASAGEDLSSKVGQRVQVTGSESALSASAGTPGASASAGTSGGMAGTTSGATGAQTGTGATGAIGAPSSGTGAGTSGMATSSDLHSMANQQLDVNKISSVGSCPQNWNPSVPQSSGSTPSQTR